MVRIGLIKSNGRRVRQKENRRYYVRIWNHEGQEKKEDEKKENEI